MLSLAPPAWPHVSASFGKTLNPEIGRRLTWQRLHHWRVCKWMNERYCQALCPAYVEKHYISAVHFPSRQVDKYSLLSQRESCF